MSLFPLIAQTDSGSEPVSSALPLYREVDWNFTTNRPVWRNGEPVFVTGARAVLVWAWNALHTPRFAHDVYSHAYGLNSGALLGRPYTEGVLQSEAARIIRETLTVNPYITSVDGVDVTLSGGTLQVSFGMTTIYGEVKLDGCDITL